MTSTKAVLLACLATTLTGLGGGGGALQALAADADGVKDTPALWTVRDDDTTVYLFGLPRFMGKDTQWNRAAFDGALAASDSIVLESDQTSPEAQAAMQALAPQLGVSRDGSKLSERLAAGDLARLKSVTAGLGVPLQAIDPLKPWLAAIQLQAMHMQRQGWTGHPTPGEVIAEVAAAGATTLRYLEGPTDLLQTVAALPEDTHLAMLSQALELIETEPDQAADILAAWTSGDAARLAEIFHGEGAWADERLRTAMLIARNAAWTKEIAAMMRSETGVIFVAVGAGHLVGRDSIVKRLREMGFTTAR